jgi:hypothetical protein
LQLLAHVGLVINETEKVAGSNPGFVINIHMIIWIILQWLALTLGKSANETEKVPGSNPGLVIQINHDYSDRCIIFVP